MQREEIFPKNGLRQIAECQGKNILKIKMKNEHENHKADKALGFVDSVPIFAEAPLPF